MPHSIARFLADRLPAALVTLAAFAGFGLNAGCEQEGGQAQAPPPATSDDGIRTRSSALGKAMDAAERTEREIEAYQEKVMEEADRIFETGRDQPPSRDGG